MSGIFRTVANTNMQTVRVLNAAEKAEKKVLYRVGGFLLKTAKRSIRLAKYRYSKPGEPPRGKTGILRNSMSFAVDGRSVVVGPRLTSTKDPRNIAKIHEFGGTINRRKGRVLIPKKELRNESWAAGEEPYPSKTDPKLMNVVVPAVREYEPRPYMGPALKKTVESGKFPEMFKGQVR